VGGRIGLDDSNIEGETYPSWDYVHLTPVNLSGLFRGRLESVPKRWEYPIVSAKMKAANVDDRRRVVLPESCPPNSAVIIQQVDEDTWLIKRARPAKDFVILAIPSVERLPDDPEWDKVERAFGQRAGRSIPEPKE
jgi:hypothetical protein